MTGLRALTRAGSRACAARRGRRGQTGAGLRAQLRHPLPRSSTAAGQPTRIVIGPRSDIRAAANVTTAARHATVTIDRVRGASPPASRLGRARPCVGVKGTRPASGSSRRGGCGVSHGVRDPRTPSRRRPLHRQARSTVTAPLPSLVNIDYWQVEAAERMLDVLGFPSGARSATTGSSACRISTTAAGSRSTGPTSE